MHSGNNSEFTDHSWWWSLSSPLIDPALFLFPNSNQDRTINHSSTAPSKLHTPIFECYRLLLRKDWTRNLTVVLLQFGNIISESFVALSEKQSVNTYSSNCVANEKNRFEFANILLGLIFAYLCQINSARLNWNSTKRPFSSLTAWCMVEQESRPHSLVPGEPAFFFFF